MIIVHHLNDSRSQRILWLLEELGLEYEIQRYERDAETMLAPESLLEVHPLGKSPVVEDGEVIVAESGAIIEYLVAQYGDGNFRPLSNSAEHRRYTYWMHYAEGSLMPPLLLNLVFTRLSEGPVPFFMKPLLGAISGKVKKAYISPQIKRHLDFVDQSLAHTDWFAGDKFSAADVQMSFPLEAARARGTIGDDRSHIIDWLERIHARPAYQRALERGGDYALVS